VEEGREEGRGKRGRGGEEEERRRERRVNEYYTILYLKYSFLLPRKCTDILTLTYY
jgi:hypothetical protein